MEEKRARRERREKREREAAMKKNKAVRQTTTLGGESEMNTKAEKTMGAATGRQGCTRKMVRGGEGVTEVTRSDSNTDGRGTETETDADTDTDMDDDHDDDDDVNIDEESDIDDDGDDDGIFAPQKDITSLLVIIVIICFLFYNLTAYRSGQR